MIVRIQILNNFVVANPWAIFTVDDTKNLKYIFSLIKSGMPFYKFINIYDILDIIEIIETCHAIANLGFQGVGLKRQTMNSDSERVIKNLNCTAEIRKAFPNHKDLETDLQDSMRPAKSLVEIILSCLSL